MSYNRRVIANTLGFSAMYAPPLLVLEKTKIHTKTAWGKKIHSKICAKAHKSVGELIPQAIVMRMSDELNGASEALLSTDDQLIAKLVAAEIALGQFV